MYDISPTCFGLYKAIIRQAVYKKYIYSKFYRRCACVELNTILSIEIPKNV